MMFVMLCLSVGVIFGVVFDRIYLLEIERNREPK